MPTDQPSEHSARFEGIVPPLVTPLKARDKLDSAGLETLLERVITGGVRGVFILGTTGEAPSLSYRLRREMIRETLRIVAGRVPVLTGVTDTAFVESVELARFACDSGAAAAVLTTPYYFPVGQTELAAYIRNIIAEIPLPVMLYNMPGLTKVWFEMETLRQLAELETIVGVKDSSGDLAYFAELCKLKQDRPDWSVLIGPEDKLVDAHQAGADGGVHGGANIAPELFVQLHQALVAGQQTDIDALQSQVLRLQAIYDVGKYASRHVKATKSALSILNICNDLPADPFHPFFEPERAQVAAVLRQLSLL